tara:strand:- start:240 stop:416 length:177 start_codon:yes stop_codon:yes gene_type:complete
MLLDADLDSLKNFILGKQHGEDRTWTPALHGITFKDLSSEHDIKCSFNHSSEISEALN